MSPASNPYSVPHGAYEMETGRWWSERVRGMEEFQQDVASDDAEIDRLLAEGWEPFSTGPDSRWDATTIFFRRRRLGPVPL